ncbi:MAG: cell division protein ZapA [Alphaproteobacteria bacterium]|nr:cell division protein ZapA [Alphaproteobacteria bacterium]
MGRVTITIDKREYAITCDDGQEGHIVELSRILDEKAKLLSSSVGMINENMMLAMVGLLLADELKDIKEKGAAGEQVVSVQNFDIKEVDIAVSRQVDEQTAKINNIIKSIKPL